MRSMMLEAALDYRRRGWSIFPMNTKSKRPSVRWKQFQAERATESQIEEWYSESEHGIGVILGDVSGNLVCRDFDDLETYNQWAEKQPELAQTLPTVETARGRHVYATASPKHISDVRSQIGKSGGTGAIVAAGGELRCGVGCYNVLAPSVHESGHKYRWLVSLPEDSLPELDLIAAGFIRLHTSDTSCSSNTSNPSNSVHRVEENRYDNNDEALIKQIRSVIKVSQPTKIGERNNKIWNLVMGWRALPELVNESALNLLPYLKEWHEMAIDSISTKPFADSARDFIRAWNNFNPDRAALINKKAQAEAKPLPEFDDHGIDGLRPVAALCREMQLAIGKHGTFYLSCRSLATLYAVSHKTASNWLSLLTTLGVIELRSKGTHKNRKASEYRYIEKM